MKKIFLGNVSTVKQTRLTKMVLEQIREKLPQQDIFSLYRALGYQSISKAMHAIYELYKYNDIAKWLASGYYDFVYTPEEFLRKLCEVFEIDNTLVNQTISDAKDYNQQFSKLSKC